MTTQEMIYDVIGLGFGASNLAIAGAFVDRIPSRLSNLLFIEKKAEFMWHPGMLLPGVRMQVNFLKDLATLRSPQSPITFISYLHSQNRLVDFINCGSSLPTRKEFSDYLRWAARYIQNKGVTVAYGENVVSLDKKAGKLIQVNSIVLSTGMPVVRLTKNLIISPGGAPRMPKLLRTIQDQATGRIIHSSTYLSSIVPLLKCLQDNNVEARPLRIAVIGSGQSGAEVVLDLHSRLQSVPCRGEENHIIDMIIRKGSLKPNDGTPFSNEIFNPEGISAMYNLPTSSARQRIRKEFENTNYGVVSHQTLERLYEVLYDQKLDEGILRRDGCLASAQSGMIRILLYSEILFAEVSHPPDTAKPECGEELLPEWSGPITITTQHTLTHLICERTYDAIVCATGYDIKAWLQLLTSSKLGRHFGLEEDAHEVCLAVESDLDVQGSGPHSCVATNGQNGIGSPFSTSISTSISTPLTSQDSVEYHTPKCQRVFVSRAYRLLPRSINHTESLQARIYVQGVAEETHGLSDTLLSVIGIRAGDVVEDICAGLDNL